MSNNFKFPKYSDNWNELSRKCKKRDQNKCTHCHKPETKNNRLHAHHIISKSKGGRDDLANLRTLCENCHRIIHPHMKKTLKDFSFLGKSKNQKHFTLGRKKNEKKKALCSSKRISKIFQKKT